MPLSLFGLFFCLPTLWNATRHARTSLGLFGHIRFKTAELRVLRHLSELGDPRCSDETESCSPAGGVSGRRRVCRVMRCDGGRSRYAYEEAVRKLRDARRGGVVRGVVTTCRRLQLLVLTIYRIVKSLM